MKSILNLLIILCAILEMLVLTNCSSDHNNPSSVNKSTPQPTGPAIPGSPQNTVKHETTKAEYDQAKAAVRGQDLQLGKFVTDSTDPLACKTMVVTQIFSDDRGVPEVAVKLKDCPSSLDSKFGTDYDGEKNRIVYEAMGTDVGTPAFGDALYMWLKISDQSTIFAYSKWSTDGRDFYADPEFQVYAKYHRIK